MSQRAIMISLTILLSLSFILGGCNKRQVSGLQHVDNPDTRGGSEALPWHFHTGEGYSVESYTNANSGSASVLRSKCDLDQETVDPNCKEKVYFFTRSEIDSFINMAKDVHDAHLKAHGGALATASTIAIISGKAAAAGFIAPDVTISKVAAIGSGVAAGIAAIVVAWEGWQMSKILVQLQKIDVLMSEETEFVQRCGHLRKDFLDRAQKLGVSIVFAKNGGDYIDANEYRNAVKIENDLYDRTLAYARQKGVTTRQAYNDYFSTQCGQLPMVNLTRSDRLFASEWANVPEDLKQNALEVAKTIALKSAEPVQFTKFDGNDLTSNIDRQTINAALLQMAADIRAVESKGNAQEKAKLQEFRNKFQRIIVQPRWSMRDWFSNRYYAAQDQNQHFLHVYAAYSWTGRSYDLSLRPYLVNELGVRESIFAAH